MSNVLFSYDATAFTNSVRYEYQEPSYSFGEEQGFMFAFAVIDLRTEDFEDPLST